MLNNGLLQEILTGYKDKYNVSCPLIAFYANAQKMLIFRPADYFVVEIELQRVKKQVFPIIFVILCVIVLNLIFYIYTF
jgi:hypothetical protein